MALMKQLFPTRPHHTTFAFLTLYLGYLLFQLFFIPNSSFSVDEFWFAHHIYEYTQQLPYRDFLPYKTVLGYYLLCLPYFFSHALFTPFYIKYEIALINMLLFAVTGRWLTRFFDPKAVFYTLLLAFSGQFFLIYSVDLRVDMLTAWLAFISILFLLSNRAILSGLALGISFLISQKALWFFAAGNIALIINWIFLTRDLKTARSILLFNSMMGLTIFIYIFIWSIFSNHQLVLDSIFYEGYLQSKITWYAQIYYPCWQAILSHGPLLFLLWPLTLLGLIIRKKNAPLLPRDVFIAVFAAMMLLFIVSYQQAFPYQMVYCFPVFMLLYANFFDWFFSLLNEPFSIVSFINDRMLFWFIAIYSILVMSILIIFGLAIFNYLIILIPIFTGFLIHALKKNETHSIILFRNSIFIFILLTGIFYPLTIQLLNAAHLSNRYQRSVVRLADALLKENGSYFAGIHLLYDRDQSIEGLKNLIGPTLDYLYKPSKELLPIYLTSLDLVPKTTDQIIAALKDHPVKFYVNNYRIWLLPPKIQTFLAKHYTHFWGSVYIYAPTVLKTANTFTIHFSGRYRVQSAAAITIDHKQYEPFSQIVLKTGVHTSLATENYQLTYMPDLPFKLTPTVQEDDWILMTKAIVL